MVPAAPELLTVHALAVHAATDVNVPSVWHVAVPPPEYPVRHVTVMLWPVTPAMLFGVALFELATCVAVHALALQVTALNAPFEPQVVQALPV